MKRKTTFLLYCLVGVILFSSACLWYVRAADQNSSNCASYLKDYLEKTQTFEDARKTLRRAHVARAKSYHQDIPPDYKDLEDEYDRNKNESFNKLIEGLGPQLPTGVSDANSFNNFANIVAALANNIFSPARSSFRILIFSFGL